MIHQHGRNARNAHEAFSAVVQLRVVRERQAIEQVLGIGRIEPKEARDLGALRVAADRLGAIDGSRRNRQSLSISVVR